MPTRTSWLAIHKYVNWIAVILLCICMVDVGFWMSILKQDISTNNHILKSILIYMLWLHLYVCLFLFCIVIIYILPNNCIFKLIGNALSAIEHLIWYFRLSTEHNLLVLSTSHRCHIYYFLKTYSWWQLLLKDEHPRRSNQIITNIFEQYICKYYDI